MKTPFTFLGNWVPGVEEGNLHVVTGAFVAALLALGAVILYPRLRRAARNVLPDKGFSLRNVFEVLLDLLTGLCEEVIGPGGRKYLPFVGTIFFFILGSNLIGLVPGFLPPTENWATGAAVATISFLGFNYFGFREHGWSYLKHFLAPVSPGPMKSVLAWVIIIVPICALHALFGAIELVSMLFRPVTLSVRLYANIFADHTVLGVFSGLIPYLVPLPFLVLGIFVSFMQAFIFTLLTVVYISGAVSHRQ